jgi:hypothetical protein
MPDFVDVTVPFRKPGLMAGYPHAGLLSLFAIIFTMHYRKEWSSLKFNTVMITLAFSLIVTSRTSLILSIIPFSLFFVNSIFSKKVFFKFIIFLIFGVSVIIFLLSILPNDTYEVAFEFFINIIQEKKFNTQSSDALIESYMLPYSAFTWLFGNGKFMRNDLGRNVDDGFQILLYGCGIFYLILNLFLFIYYWLISLKSTEINFQKYQLNIFFIIVLIVNTKADVLFSRVTSDIFVFFLTVAIVNHNKNYLNSNFNYLIFHEKNISNRS